MISAVAISNELEQVCSLAHLKASRDAEKDFQLSVRLKQQVNHVELLVVRCCW